MLMKFMVNSVHKELTVSIEKIEMEMVKMLLAQFENMYISLTELRENLSTVVKTLTGPKILMSRDKPKAVLVPYELYKQMEAQIEAQKKSNDFDALARELLES